MGSPWFRGGIESALGGLSADLFHSLSGTTFSDLRHRKERDYDSNAEACIYLSRIDEVLVNHIVDVYAETPHAGIGNRIPAREWERKLEAGFEPNLPHNAAELTTLLGEVEHRDIWQYGVQWDYLFYNDDKLGPLRGKLKGAPTKVKRHPGDLSRIHVYDPFERRYIEAPVDEAYREYVQGLSAWKHRVIRAFARANGDKIDPASLGRARLRIQSIVDEGRARRKINKRMSRWDTAGRPSRAFEMRQPDITLPQTGVSPADAALPPHPVSPPRIAPQGLVFPMTPSSGFEIVSRSPSLVRSTPIDEDRNSDPS